MEATLECQGICQLDYISGSQPPGQSMHSMITYDFFRVPGNVQQFYWEIIKNCQELLNQSHLPVVHLNWDHRDPTGWTA